MVLARAWGQEKTGNYRLMALTFNVSHGEKWPGDRVAMAVQRREGRRRPLKTAKMVNVICYVYVTTKIIF